MDKYLRFFIKFHGYCIAIGSIILTIYFTAMFYEDDKHARWMGWITLRYEPVPAIVFGILWMLANVCLLAALICEKKLLVYPFCAIFSIDLQIFIMAYMFNSPNESWSWFRVVTPFFPLFVIFVMYVTTSMLALIRLFNLELNSSRSDPALV